MSAPLTLIFGSDHGGFERKTSLKEWSLKQGYQIHDVGAFSLDPEDDYPAFAKAVAELISQKNLAGEVAMGVLICRSGGGMTIAANRFAGIRAVSVTSSEMAYHARAHNNANVIVLSGDWSTLTEMEQFLQVFLDTPFSQDPRHVRRNAQLDALATTS